VNAQRQGRHRSVALLLTLLALTTTAALADVVVLSIPAASAERGIPLQPGDRLSAPPGMPDLDVYQWQALESVAAAKAAVRVRRQREGLTETIEISPGRWEVIVGPVIADPDLGMDLDLGLDQALRTGNADQIGAMYLARAQMAAKRREFDAAIAEFAAALTAAPAREAAFEYAQALAFDQYSDRQRGLRAADRAVSTRRAESDPLSLAASLQWQAYWRAQTRDNPGAVEAATEATRLGGDSLIAANAHIVLSFVAMRSSKAAEAAFELDSASRIIDRIAPTGLDAASLLARRALLSATMRQGDQATQAYALAMPELRRLAPQSMILGRTTFNAHLHALELRLFALAESYARESMGAFGAIAPEGLEFAQARAALAEVLMRRTQFVEAESLFRLAWTRANAIDARSYEALSLHLQLGEAIRKQQRHAEALTIFDGVSAVVIEESANNRLNDSAIAADVALYRAVTLSALNRCAEAITSAQNALNGYRQKNRIGTTTWEAHLELSDCARRERHLASAIEHARAALAGFAAMSADGIQPAQAQFILARALRDDGQDQAAIDAYMAAIAGLEAHRERVGGNDEIRARWAAQFQVFYQELMWMQARAGATQAVLDLDARYRVQSLLQMLDDADPEFADAWTLRRESATSPVLAADMAMISYVSGDDGTVASVRVAGSAPRVFTLARTRAQLTQAVDRMLLLGARPSAEVAAINAMEQVGNELYTALIAPLLPVIDGHRHWIVIADGALLRTPWPALVSQRGVQPRYLIEDRVIGIAPSMPVWRLLAERAPAASGILAFADPSLGSATLASTRGLAHAALPGARSEVAALAQRFPGRVTSFSGELASEAQLRASAPAAGLIHLALHSVSNTQAPLDSHIVLAAASATNVQDDGLLHANEIAHELKLHADLIVLSSCASAIGADVGGEGLLGLIRALHLAGSRAIIGTTWPVSDRSTARFMTDFYDRLGQGESSDLALASAQRTWLARARAPSWGDQLARLVGADDALPAQAAHPFYWAGFIHSGAAAR